MPLSLKKNIDRFNLASDTFINQEKTQFFFINTSPCIQRHLATLLGFQILSLPTKYLGDPLLPKALHNPSLELLLAKMESKLRSWTHRSLSLPGRALLISSLNPPSVPFLSSSCLDEVHVRNFRSHPVSVSLIFQPKLNAETPVSAYVSALFQHMSQHCFSIYSALF